MGIPHTENKKEFAQAVGKNICKYRKERGLTLRELSEKTEYSTGYIGVLEKGQSTPNSYVLTEIARVLHIPVSALFGEKDIDNKLHTFDDPILTDPNNQDYLEIMKEAIISDIPPEKLKKAIDFANDL